MLDETRKIISANNVNVGNRQRVHTDPTVKKVLLNRITAPTVRAIARAPITNLQTYLLPPLEQMRTPPVLTVVYDLDETLVSNRHANLPHAILRPYALHVLNALREMPGVEIVLWTASTVETATPVLRQLQDRAHIFDEVICRDKRWFTEPIHTKDLRQLGRDMNRVVIFDNAVGCCKLNAGNAVLVEDFTGHPDQHNRHDGSLINTYYIVDHLLKAIRSGYSVREGLERLVTEDQLCESVRYSLPQQWAGVNIREYAPLNVPPHGVFTRAFFETAAPLVGWTI